eukprot:1667945-Rhodomonas_salina.1
MAHARAMPCKGSEMARDVLARAARLLVMTSVVVLRTVVPARVACTVFVLTRVAVCDAVFRTDKMLCDTRRGVRYARCSRKRASGKREEGGLVFLGAVAFDGAKPNGCPTV